MFINWVNVEEYSKIKNLLVCCMKQFVHKIECRGYYSNFIDADTNFKIYLAKETLFVSDQYCKVVRSFEIDHQEQESQNFQPKARISSNNWSLQILLLPLENRNSRFCPLPCLPHPQATPTKTPQWLSHKQISQYPII